MSLGTGKRKGYGIGLMSPTLMRMPGRKWAFSLLALSVAHFTQLLPMRVEAVVDGLLINLFAESFHLWESRR